VAAEERRRLRSIEETVPNAQMFRIVRSPKKILEWKEVEWVLDNVLNQQGVHNMVLNQFMVPHR